MLNLASDRGGATPTINPAHPGPAIRTQRPRKRGYRAPQGTIYVGRPTYRANPFDPARFGHARYILLHRRWLSAELGAHVECWCPITSKWCHADALVTLANGGRV